MKINVKRLMETSGISCFKISPDAHGGYDHSEARAAFVTDATLEAARAEAERHGEGYDPHSPDVRYGDVLVSWQNEGGAWCGTHARAGQDAGIHIALADGERSSILPFTGSSMFMAHDRLTGILASRRRLDEGQSRILEGIRGVFDVIMGASLRGRFPDALTGQVFATHIAGATTRLSLGVTYEEFARHAKIAMIRARIAAENPDHPEAATRIEPLGTILDRVLGKDISPIVRQGTGAAIDEALLRRIARNNPALGDGVIGSLTRTPISSVSARALSLEDMKLLSRAMSRSRLSGDWVEAAGARMNALTDDLLAGMEAQVEIYNIGRRDILVLKDTMSEQSGGVYLYSWPQTDRRPFSDHGGIRLYHLSPEEVPPAREVERLRRALDELDYGPTEGGKDEIEKILA